MILTAPVPAQLEQSALPEAAVNWEPIERGDSIEFSKGEIAGSMGIDFAFAPFTRGLCESLIRLLGAGWVSRVALRINDNGCGGSLN